MRKYNVPTVWMLYYHCRYPYIGSGREDTLGNCNYERASCVYSGSASMERSSRKMISQICPPKYLRRALLDQTFWKQKVLLCKGTVPFINSWVLRSLHSHCVRYMASDGHWWYPEAFLCRCVHLSTPHPQPQCVSSSHGMHNLAIHVQALEKLKTWQYKKSA